MKVLLFLLIFTTFFCLVLPVERVKVWARHHWNGIHRGGLTVCGMLVFSVVAGGLVAVTTERFRFYEEATVLSTVAAFHHGQALYTDARAPVEYSLLYGPVTYFVYLPPLLGGAERVAGYEAWSLAALAAVFAVIFMASRPRFGTSVAIGSAALVGAIVSRVTDNVWAIKADVWILLFAAAGFFAALRLRPWVATLVIAVAGAMLVDLKATLVLIALLPFVLLWQRELSARLAAMVGAISLPALALLPFAMQRVSLRNYFALLLEYKGRATAAPMLRINAEMVLLILLPTLALGLAAVRVNATETQQWMRGRAAFLAIFAAACLVAVVTGAKVGGGPWHCAVLVIPAVLLNAELWQIVARRGGRWFLLEQGWPAALVLGVGCALFVTGCSALVSGVKLRLHDAPGEAAVSMPAVEKDLLAIMESHAGRTMQMGYSDRAHYNLTYLRPMLQIRGNPLFIDGNARNEADLIRKPVSEAVLQALRRCDIDLWVIPKGGEPFAMESPYFMDPLVDRTRMQRDLYPEVFRRTFREHYRPVASGSRYFDLWACDGRGSS